MVLEINKRFYPIDLRNVQWYEFVDGKLMLAYPAGTPSKIIDIPDGVTWLTVKAKLETAFEKILA